MPLWSCASGLRVKLRTAGGVFNGITWHSVHKGLTTSCYGSRKRVAAFRLVVAVLPVNSACLDC